MTDALITIIKKFQSVDNWMQDVLFAVQILLNGRIWVAATFRICVSLHFDCVKEQKGVTWLPVITKLKLPGMAVQRRVCMLIAGGLQALCFFVLFFLCVFFFFFNFLNF